MGGVDANELKKQGKKLDASQSRPMEIKRDGAAGKKEPKPTAPWPDLVPLASTSKAPAFPVEAFARAGLQPFVEQLAASLYIRPDTPAVLMLSAVSSATAGRLRVCIRPDYSQPALIYGVAIAPPSELKSPAFRAVMAPVFAFQSAKRKAERGDLEAMAAQLDVNKKALEAAKKDAAKEGTAAALKKVDELARKIAENPLPIGFQLITGSPTPAALASLLARQRGRIAVLSDEAHGLAKLLIGSKDNGGVDLGPLLQGYDGAPYGADRKQAESSNIDAAFVTIGLTAQNHVLEQLAAARGMTELGLTARISYAVPERMPGVRPYRLPPLPNEVRTDYEKLIGSLLEWGHAKRGEGEEAVFLTDEADAELEQFHVRTERARQPGGLFAEVPALNEWAGKHVARVARIAALLHAAERIAEGAYPGEGKIAGETMCAAIKIGEYLVAHALRAFDVMNTDRGASDALAVIEWAGAKGHTCIKANDVWRHLRRRFNGDREELSAALRRLCAHGYLRRLQGKAEAYELNPVVTTITTPSEAASRGGDSATTGNDGAISHLSPLSPDFGGARARAGGEVRQ